MLKPIRLYEAVEAHYGNRKRCPCCARPMKMYNTHKGKYANRPTPTDARTVGHVFNSRAGQRDIWFNQCRQCNEDQGSMELIEWGRLLVRRQDRRAGAVAELSKVVYGWLDGQGVGRRAA